MSWRGGSWEFWAGKSPWLWRACPHAVRPLGKGLTYPICLHSGLHLISMRCLTLSTFAISDPEGTPSSRHYLPCPLPCAVAGLLPLGAWPWLPNSPGVSLSLPESLCGCPRPLPLLTRQQESVLA